MQLLSKANLRKPLGFVKPWSRTKRVSVDQARALVNLPVNIVRRAVSLPAILEAISTETSTRDETEAGTNSGEKVRDSSGEFRQYEQDLRKAIRLSHVIICRCSCQAFLFMSTPFWDWCGVETRRQPRQLGDNELPPSARSNFSKLHPLNPLIDNDAASRSEGQPNEPVPTAETSSNANPPRDNVPSSQPSNMLSSNNKIPSEREPKRDPSAASTDKKRFRMTNLIDDYGDNVIRRRILEPFTLQRPRSKPPSHNVPSSEPENILSKRIPSGREPSRQPAASSYQEQRHTSNQRKRIRESHFKNPNVTIQRKREIFPTPIEMCLYRYLSDSWNGAHPSWQERLCWFLLSLCSRRTKRENSPSLIAASIIYLAATLTGDLPTCYGGHSQIEVLSLGVNTAKRLLYYVELNRGKGLVSGIGFPDKPLTISDIKNAIDICNVRLAHFKEEAKIRTKLQKLTEI